MVFLYLGLIRKHYIGSERLNGIEGMYVSSLTCVTVKSVRVSASRSIVV